MLAFTKRLNACEASHKLNIRAKVSPRRAQTLPCYLVVCCVLFVVSAQPIIGYAVSLASCLKRVAILADGQCTYE